ncbi:MAG TPA: tyrosine-protein phosphatase [Friedmanniella sp.]
MTDDFAPYGSALARRSVLVGALGVAGTALVGAPAAQAATSVGSHVRETYLAAGGREVLGAPTHEQVKLRISHHQTYGQQFEQGTVWWGSDVGKVDLPWFRVRLDTAPNFRPVVGVRDLWRSDDLDGCTSLEKRIVVDLGIETMIGMNSGSDPSIPGVDLLSYRIGNDGDPLDFYRGYVTSGSSRDAVGEVVRCVARSDAPVLVHCHSGKDRTGWVCDVLQALAGVGLDVRDQDYLATRWYSGGDVQLAWLTAAREQLTADYRTVMDYLIDGCALDADDVVRLAARLR